MSRKEKMKSRERIYSDPATSFQNKITSVLEDIVMKLLFIISLPFRVYAEVVLFQAFEINRSIVDSAREIKAAWYEFLHGVHEA